MGELTAILELEPLELDLFRGFTPPGDGRRIFGGQVVAQALIAAYRTVEARVCHSMHAYFIRPGDPTIPILFKVERVRDGGSFGVRRVVAIQHGKQIFNLAASFQTPEDGFEHQIETPPAPGPEGVPNEEERRAAAGDTSPRKLWPIEVKPMDVPPHGVLEPREPRYAVWIRARESVGPDLTANQCALAYASDMTLLDASLLPHPKPWDELQVASLDHAVWFHRPTDFSRWHLYVQDSPSASGARGFNRGSLFDPEGRLVASVAQEALIRHRLR